MVTFAENEAGKTRLAQYLISGMLAKIEAGLDLDAIDYDVIVAARIENGIIDALKLRRGENPDAGGLLNWLDACSLPVEYNFPWEQTKKEVMTIQEAARLWDQETSTIRKACLAGRFTEEEAWKSGGTWLVTAVGMERLYGKKQ